MNYIDRINAFWTWKSMHLLSPKAMVLYMAILQCANRANWQSEVHIPNSTLLSLTDMPLSDIYRKRNDLIREGLIKYQNGKRGQSGIYMICDGCFQIDRRISDNMNTNSVTNPVTNSVTNPVTNSVTNSGNIYRQKTKDIEYKETLSNERVKKTPKRFHPPTLEEVRAFAEERRSNVDPERFWNYYESNGWRVGKNPMKDWKRAFAGWESRDNFARDSNVPTKPIDKAQAREEARKAEFESNMDAFVAEFMGEE